MAFQFPAGPDDLETVVNSITGSTYQWREELNKWVITAAPRTQVGDIIFEGDDAPDPRGDYKLWYHTEELELYYWYEDSSGVGAWLPTSTPITLLEDLDASVAEIKADMVAANVAINENTNAIASIVYFGDSAPPIFPDEFGEQSPLNYKFWVNTSTDILHILRLDDEDLRTYKYEPVSGGSEIWLGEDPPTEDKYELWFDTLRLELLVKFNGQWWPVSIPADQLEDLRKVVETELQGVFDEISKVENEAFQGIRDLKYSLDLNQVLENGNIADKNIILTNAEDDVIDLSVTERRIVMGAIGEDSVPKFELRLRNGLDTSTGAIEIDENGTRLDFEAEGKIDNMHFRFQNADKLILNKTGAAVFSGKVQAQPGTDVDELVTYGQLLTVEEELEQLAPSLERGRWEYTSDPNPGPGKYTLIKEMLSPESQQTICELEYTQCLLDANSDPTAQSNCNREKDICIQQIDPEGKIVTTDKFAEADQILFNNLDSQGVEHDFVGIDDDHLLDLFNENDESFGVYDIVNHGDGLFNVDVNSTRGTAAGLARLKIFKIAGAVNFDQYIRKAGDTMSGQLEIKGNARSEPLFLLEPTDSRDTNTIFRINDKEGDDILEIMGNGQAFYERTPTAGAELVNKSYVDDKLSVPTPSNFSWSFRKISGSPIPGEMVCTSANPGKGAVITFSHTDFNGNKFHKRTDTILFNSALATPLITIWDKTTEGYRHKLTMCVRSISQDSDGNLRVEMGENAGATNHNLSENNVEHWVTIGGFF